MIRHRGLFAAAWLHVTAFAWVVAMLAFAGRAPDAYASVMREDGVVEWWTAALFAAAAGFRLRAAIRARRPLDLLVALFCLFVAGEEISWGQRLLGITPPAPFLELNTQQELNVHNFADVFGKPKWILTLALAGFGFVLPLTARIRPLATLLERAGGTPPSLPFAAWFCAAAGLLVWYPVEFTGEWTECLAGALFLGSADLRPRTAGLAAAAFVVAVALSASGSGPSSASDARHDCARREATALLEALTDGGMATDQLASMQGTVHKRLWTAAEDGYVDLAQAGRYRAVRCAGDAAGGSGARRKYIVDPWGMAYWVRTGPLEDGGHRAVSVYSFGANRRRDSGEEAEGAERPDDVIAAGSLRAP